MIQLLLLVSLFLQQNNERNLYVFTKDPKNNTFKQQIQLLEKKEAGVRERHIKVKKVIYSDANSKNFQKSKVNGAFAVILIGKDGGEKFRSEKIVQPKQLFSIIDAMPMRKREVKNSRK